jgi:hypothetical protein
MLSNLGVAPAKIAGDQVLLPRGSTVILLVSPNHLASRFFASYELPQLLNAAYKKDITLLWFLVEYCAYEHIDIGKVQSVLSPTRPLSTLNDMELNKALSAISQAILNAIKYD